MEHGAGKLSEPGFWRDTAKQVLLLVLLLITVVSPFPEWLLGSWLRLENGSRDTLGRAHERRNLANESRQAAEELSQTVERRRHESGAIVSLGALRDHLERYGELGLTRRELLEFYSALPQKQSATLVSPDSLLRLVYSNGLNRAQFNQNSGANGSTELLIFDGDGARLARFEFPLIDQLDLELGLTAIAQGEGPFDLSGVVVELSFDRWVASPDTLPDCRAALTRLALDPYNQISRVLQNAQGTIYVELHHEDDWSLKRFIADHDSVDHEGYNLPARQGLRRIWPWSRP